MNEYELSLEPDFQEEVFCETCGKLEPYTAIFSDRMTTWCLWCVNSVIPLSTEEIREVERKQKTAKIKYFKKRLKELEETK